MIFFFYSAIFIMAISSFTNIIETSVTMDNEMDTINKIGFGGSCHWCTEAIFQSLKGVIEVQQGWIASEGDASGFSEGVVVHFNTEIISLNTLIAIHLHTHSCTSAHHLRSKYRSAIYFFNEDQIKPAVDAVSVLQNDFENEIITEVIPFVAFRLNTEEYLNYYYSNPQKPFCENIVSAKLKLLLKHFSENVDQAKLTESTSQ